MSDDRKSPLTFDEAVALLADGDPVHTFARPATVLCHQAPGGDTMTHPVNPLPCGCRADCIMIIGEDSTERRMVVQHCPLHKAAGQMLQACEGAALLWDRGETIDPDQGEVDAIRAAIAAARKEPTP